MLYDATIGAYPIQPWLHYRSHSGNGILQSEPFVEESHDFIMTINGSAINVFISYVHEDEALLRQLQTHLSPLKRQGLIATWTHWPIGLLCPRSACEGVRA
ncbi:MAG TPA: hypothetical protein VGT82_02995 [Ktedonobacteraceae bacterium]|nr:hypothetical protein [Ktedonobacteraceae bacterium]